MINIKMVYIMLVILHDCKREIYIIFVRLQNVSREIQKTGNCTFLCKLIRKNMQVYIIIMNSR